MTAKSHSTKGWLIALAIFALLAALVIALWQWILPYYIEKRSVGTLSSLTGRDVTLEQVSIDPFDAQVTFDQLRIAGEADQPVLASETITAKLQWRSLWESGWWLDSLSIEGLHLQLIHRQDGSWNLVQLFAGDKDASQEKTPIRIALIDVDQGKLDVVNRRLPEPVTLSLDAIQMEAKDYDNTNEQPFTLNGQADWNGGTLEGQGEMGFAPWTVNLDFAVDHLPITTLSGYFNSVRKPQLTDGTLAADISLQAGRAGDGATKVQGGANINDAALSYPDKQQPLAKVKQLEVTGLDFDSGAKSLQIQRIALDAPWTEVIIDENLETNFSVWQSTSQKGSSQDGSQGSSQDQALSYSIAEISLDDGSLAFADRHLPQPVSVDFSQLGGTWKNLDSGSGSNSSEDGKIDIKGQVFNEPMQIQGRFDPLGEAIEGDLQLDFEKLDLAAFSPYARRFGGYAIDQGQTTLKLDHRIEDGRLITNNHLTLQRIELGEKDDSASASLPLRTIIDVLQSDDGMIELDVPMTLPLDNPSAVEVGKILGDALTETLENLLSSPIETLSEATGVGDEEDAGDE